jgi:hypothetical protein
MIGVPEVPDWDTAERGGIAGYSVGSRLNQRQSR